MMELHLRSVDGDRLVPVNLGGLALSVRGELSFQKETGAMPDKIRTIDGDRGPAVIVRCADRRDAMQCLEFAARHGLLVTMTNDRRDPRSWDGCAQGIAVDLSAMSRKGARHLAQTDTAG
ncbi:hypothetical protein HC341_04505 [Aquisalimonas sp. 2447]|uniref:hypothetical protein n=1 Tax=Aquisalimonas sp. 2447 TaxID=2740807 RepID=UPI0014327DCD|nr:hypothetical protein [Aquisalimonas sp. 2447]QIT54543.1 hypothetical protein HC341_04505 [Aquisalimonas sp. 2447]